MANLIRYLAGRTGERGLGFQQWVDMLNFNNVLYPTGYAQTLTGDREELHPDYTGLAKGAFQGNGIVFACMYTRMLHFMQARFQFQQMRNGAPGKLFGTPDLALLETPWPNGTTADLLARMIQDVDLAGNAFIVNMGDRLARLRPDWVSILLGSTSRRDSWVAGDTDTRIVGYVYKPGGPGSGASEVVYPVEDVAHWAPIPDPSAFYRGQSLWTSVVQEIRADQSMTSHRLKYFEQGATVNLVIQPDPTVTTQEQFQEWVRIIREGHEGIARAYKTLFLANGASVTPIGSDLQQNDFRAVQAAGEVRVAVAARVPPTILHVTEGLQGSSLNAGNYQSARRQFADELLRPYWEGAAGALASIITVPGGSRLFYDDRHIAFLKEDQKDTAQIQQMQAAALLSGVNGGWEPNALIQWIASDDITTLINNHTGLATVQLQPMGGGTALNGSANASANGSPVAAA